MEVETFLRHGCNVSIVSLLLHVVAPNCYHTHAIYTATHSLPFLVACKSTDVSMCQIHHNDAEALLGNNKRTPLPRFFLEYCRTTHGIPTVETGLYNEIDDYADLASYYLEYTRSMSKVQKKI